MSKENYVPDSSNSNQASVASHSSGFGNSIEQGALDIVKLTETFCDLYHSYGKCEIVDDVCGTLLGKIALFKRKRNDAVSDTTGDAMKGKKPAPKESCTEPSAEIPFTKWLTNEGYRLWGGRASLDGNNTGYIKDGNEFTLDYLIKQWQAATLRNQNK